MGVPAFDWVSVHEVSQDCFSSVEGVFERVEDVAIDCLLIRVSQASRDGGVQEVGEGLRCGELAQ